MHVSTPPADPDPDRLRELVSHITVSPEPHGELEVRSPSTGVVFGRIPAGPAADVEAAVTRARAAQPAWSALSFAARGRIILRFHDLLLNRQDEVLDLIQMETGKARRHAFEEVLDTAIVAR